MIELEIIEIPTKVSLDFLIRTLLPGVVVFIVFLYPILYPLVHRNLGSLGFSDKLLLCVSCGFFIGLLFMLCDLYIYQILEGIRFWPRCLRKWKYERIQKKFREFDNELENLIDQKEKKSIEMSITELRELSLKISNLSAKVREFPPDYDRKNFTKRYPTYPTRFGNVLCEYEDYSLNRYGIHMMVFWGHLSQLLPKELKEELKFKGSISDLCIYLCFAGFLFAILGSTALFLQKESWIVVWNHMIPAKSFLYLLLSILASKFFYEVSITQHKNYGRLVKSVFDLYRGKLAEELSIEIKTDHFASKDELEEERAFWKKYQDYYLDYKFIKKKIE